jgi:hypothetical protein
MWVLAVLALDHAVMVSLEGGQVAQRRGDKRRWVLVVLHGVPGGGCVPVQAR